MDLAGVTHENFTEYVGAVREENNAKANAENSLDLMHLRDQNTLLNETLLNARKKEFQGRYGKEDWAGSTRKYLLERIAERYKEKTGKKLGVKNTISLRSQLRKLGEKYAFIGELSEK